jgi:hypothetical protein
MGTRVAAISAEARSMILRVALYFVLLTGLAVRERFVRGRT